jgi:hypothetical protein
VVDEMNRLILIITTCLILLAFLPETASEYVNISVSNGTVYVSFLPAQVIYYKAVAIYIGFRNITTLRIVYSGVAKEVSVLPTLIVQIYEVQNNAKNYYTSITFKPSGDNAYTSLVADVPIHEQADYYLIQVYNENGELVGEVKIKPPPSTWWKSSTILQYISILVPIGIIVAFSIRGNLRDTGLGLVLSGIIYYLLPYIGINVYNQIAVSAILVSLGATILLFLTR